MKIAIGSDHGGFDLKDELIKTVLEGHEVQDFGVFSAESVDYPDIAAPVCERVRSGEFEKGILICGTGLGMSIAANKVDGIRAAKCDDVYSAEMSRKHNDANVLCFGARVIGVERAKMIVKAWLASEFEGGRHLRRVEKIMALE